VKGKQLGIHCYIDRREGGGKEIVPWLLLLLGQPKSPSLHPVWPSPGAKPFALHASQRQPACHWATLALIVILIPLLLFLFLFLLVRVRR